MFNPLSFYQGDKAIIEQEEFTLQNRFEFILNNKTAVRYIFKNSHKTIIIEVKRELALNYQLFLYECIEELKYNNQFISILGTNTLSYDNKNLSIKPIYQKVNIKNEPFELIKHIIDEEELPLEYEKLGYYKDENDLWYFFTKKYSSTKRTYHSLEKESWEYKQDNNIRLFIEACQIDDSIEIYKGKEIKKSDIKNISLQKSPKVNSLFYRNTLS